MSHEEYLRRNLEHANAVGVTSNLLAVVARLRSAKRAPKWLIEAVHSTALKSGRASVELAKWRDAAPDAPGRER